MANPEFFKDDFYALATNGFIGDPNGELSYAYLRVSSSGQAEEGRSGLPRQIQRCHEKAQQEGYKIPWDMVFADDHTGFEFEDRPQLQILLRETKTNKRRANAIFIENLDRLSRNADWHQGYLLEQFIKYRKMRIFAWKEMGNRIVRSVMGAVSQEGMEDSLSRMKEGTLNKLRDGRITAKRPAFGFQFVDQNGDPNGAKVRRYTYYGIFESEAEIVRIIFNMIAEGNSLKKTCEYLEGLYSPPKNSKHWEMTVISKMIKNPVYKGKYVGNKYFFTKEMPESNDLIRKNAKKRVQRYIRPEEEWIYVDVPKIVSEELWQRANNMLSKNAIMAQRNGKGKFLLTGLIKCATCGRTYTGASRKSKKPNVILNYYRCASYSRPKAIREVLQCNQPSISSTDFDNLIWEIVCDLMIDPTRLLESLDNLYKNEDNTQYKYQMKYLQDQIDACDLEDRRVKQGYNAGVYNDQEAREEREIIRLKKEKHTKALDELKTKILTYEQYISKRNAIIEMSKAFQEQKFGKDTDFNLKQSVIKTVIEKITLDATQKTFEMIGMFNAVWSYENTSEDDNIDYTSANKYTFNNDENQGEKPNIDYISACTCLYNMMWNFQVYFDKNKDSQLSVVSLENVMLLDSITDTIWNTSNLTAAR